MKAAVIGAGLAGSVAARELRLGGVDPVLFDKGRGPGGRLSSRRAETPAGTLRFDHGAQFVTARTASFHAFLSSAVEAGAAQLWDARLVSIDRGGNAHPLRQAERFVGAPGMNAIVKHAQAGLNVQLQRRAVKMKGGAGDWTIHFEDGATEGPFHRVCLTLPPEQLIDFLARSDGDFAEIITEANRAVVEPCWTVMAVLDAPFDPEFDGAKIYGGAIRWMARMGSRPGGSSAEAVVIQASPDWSAAFLEESPDAVARQLCEEAYVRFAMPLPKWSGAHRWRYAMVTEPAGTPCAVAEDATVGVAGDWRLGGKAEAAWTSGEALGEALSQS
ncbi:MAG: NAD(P)-binding protein [Alphaproteobacteria bacterium]|nr:NAD(P)-binding protein [Alphaproteobacteria bacterium]